MRFRQILPFLIITILIFFPALNVQAQDDTQPLDDDFINAVVMMAVNHNLLAGDNELGEFHALNEIVTDYYDSKLNSALLSTEERDKLTNLKLDHLSKIGQKIYTLKQQTAKGWLFTILDIFTDNKQMSVWDPDAYDPDLNQHVSMVVADDDNEYSSVTRLVNARLWTDFGKTVNAFLNINTISALPSLAPAINDSSDWSYNVPAIRDSSGVIPSAGESAPPSSENDPQSQAEPTEGSGIIEKRPVRFTNNGFDSVTVLVETYDPAPGYSPGIPIGSTVVSPETNSSASLELPLGTYTFCYYWQLDEDYNNDDYFDYHHRTTSTITLNLNSSNDVNSAITVTLSPDSTVSNPNGKCGEDLAQDNSDLTTEEQANQGTHTYSSVCYGNEWCDQEVDFIVINTSFSIGSLTMEAEGDSFDLIHAGRNTYNSHANDEYGTVYTYVFSTEGFTITANTIDGKLVFTLQD